MTSSKNHNFLPPSALRHRQSSRLNPPPPSEQKMMSLWPNPPRTFIFFRFMLFKIDINVESRPSYDTIFHPKISIFFTPLPLASSSVITSQPSLWTKNDFIMAYPPPPSIFHFFRFMLFKIDINVESRPSYDTIFQYLLNLNVFKIIITI